MSKVILDKTIEVIKDDNLTTIEETAAELISVAPEVSEGAVSPLADTSANVGQRTDINNHANPAPKKRGRPAGAKGAPKSQSTIGGQAPKEEHTVSVHAEVAGVTAGLFFTLGVMTGGAEWLPDNDEKIAVESAFEQYYKSTGRTDLPPVIGLVAVLGFYASKRFGMPETQKRAIGVVQRVKIWWANRKLKKHNLQAVEAENNAG